jgi:hypothetical protein
MLDTCIVLNSLRKLLTESQTPIQQCTESWALKDCCKQVRHYLWYFLNTMQDVCIVVIHSRGSYIEGTHLKDNMGS